MDSFNTSLRRLLVTSKKILNHKDELDGNLDLDGRGNPILKCLNQYSRLFSKTRPDEIEDFHIDLFRIVFREYHDDILKTPTKWLNMNNIIIQYGSNLPEPIKCNFKIYLSHIYEISTVMKSDITDKLKDKSNKDQEELNYPTALLLHVYRIFGSFVKDRSDTAKINVIISDLEEILGIGDSPSSSSPSDGFGGLLQFVSGAAQQMGLNTEGFNSSENGGGDMGSAIKSVFENKGIKESLGKILSDVENSNDVGEVVSKLIGGLGDDNFRSAIGNAVGGITDKINDPKSEVEDSSASASKSNAEESSTSASKSESISSTGEIDSDDEIPFIDED